MIRAALLLGLLALPASAASLLTAYPHNVRVIDGDTVELVESDELVRLADIDTPETRPSRGYTPPPCEVARGRRATEAVRAILAAVEDVHVLRRMRGDAIATDRYGRTLGWLIVDGVDLGAWLVASGLARPYVPGAKGDWC